MPQRSQAVERVFAALSDPTRLAVVERLSTGPATVTELARPFQMALPSFAQHLGVLESCGLVRSRKLGRVRTYRLVPRRLEVAERWMAARRRAWETRLDQLDRYLETMEEDDQ
jgi:DNA-binding transcriptional ArsR family regulator